MTNFHAVRDLITRKAGIVIAESDLEQFRQTLEKLVRESGQHDFKEYCQLLEGEGGSSSGEWHSLLEKITVGESYFFRDTGLHTLLEQQILTDLLQQNQKSQQLRIWSAGCATGEEPYSLAILLDRLLPGHKSWNLQILGTDINRQALDRAQKAIYSDWSLRGSSDHFKKRYFTRQGQEWALQPHIRSMVEFRYGNLLDHNDISFVTGGNELDCIICRHVFIYFNTDVIAKIVSRLAGILKPGGYFIAGHNEVHGLVPASLQARIYPEAVVYQRLDKGENIREHLPFSLKEDKQAASSVPPPFPSPNATAPLNADMSIDGCLKEAQELFQTNDYKATITKNNWILKQQPDNFAALSLMARAYANIGSYRQAAETAQKAIKAQEFNSEPYYLLAHIAEMCGNKDKVKELLHKVIYLDPNFVPAYLELGSLHEQDGNQEKACSMRETALKLLLTMDPEHHLDPYDKLTVAELAIHIKKILAESSQGAQS